jgi:hypothetical protein
VTQTVNENTPPTPKAVSHSQPGRRRRVILISIFSIAGCLVITGLIVGDIFLHHAGPILKARVVDTLSTRFDSRVELDKFQVSLIKGLQVSGSGLRLFPNHLAINGPLIAIDHFSFRVPGWRQLLSTTLVVHHVEISGLSIHIPPKSQRANMPHLHGGQSGIKVKVVEIDVDDTNLVIENGKPTKVPLTFVIHKLVLRSVAAGQPMKFHATLVNPKPIGDIDTSGDFGPFDADSPGDTNVSGTYSFRNADLNTIKGIGGMLASNGTYQGQLDSITVDGETTTPDFSLDIANHTFALNTKFHAIVDGTNGDTWLQPVDAWLNHTHILAKGQIIRSPNVQGRDIRLGVTVDRGDINDLLYLADKAPQPLMNGKINLHTQFELPPGSQKVTQRLRLKGNFQLLDNHFSNPKIQSKVDELSLRGQGHPKKAKQEGDALKSGDDQAATAANVASEMRGNFTLDDGKITLEALNYRVPGAEVALQGTYTIGDQSLDFTGDARLDAHISQMVTGWKSWLLKPVDPFFAKDGSGTKVPIKISGNSSHPNVGLNF